MPFKNSRILRYVASTLTIVLIVLLAPHLAATHDSKVTKWPYTSMAKAEEVPLSYAETLIHQSAPGRRAAVLNNYIYIQTPRKDEGPALAQAEGSGASSAPGLVAGKLNVETDGKKSTEVDTVKALLPFPASYTLTRMLSSSKVPIQIYNNAGFRATLTDRIFQLLPLLFFIGLILIVARRGGAKSLGLSSSFEVIRPDKLKQGFRDVAGIDVARAEIQEIVDFLRDPEQTSRLGGKMPKGVLFSGPPGTGKTLLARAMAKEAGVPFLLIEASGVNQLFVGAGAMKIRKAFREARKRAPCIVFIDEIDALGRARGKSTSGAGDEKETTLNALLVELDGFDHREGIIVVAATNRPEILDPALTRRGRIDRSIHIDPPDVQGRIDILKVHVRGIQATEDIDYRAIALNTFGFSGADLATLVNEAALLANRRNKDVVELSDFLDARDRMVVGLSGGQRKLDGSDKRITSVHEGGHALVAYSLLNADPIEKATILPQGGALGYVLQAPSEDRNFLRKNQLIAQIRVAVAGRVAEEIVFGTECVTSGASSDIEQATRIARNMVTRFGMSQLGFVTIDPDDRALFDLNLSPLTEVRSIISAEIASVRSYIRQHKDALHALSDLLEARETLSAIEIKTLLEEHDIVRGSWSD